MSIFKDRKRLLPVNRLNIEPAAFAVYCYQNTQILVCMHGVQNCFRGWLRDLIWPQNWHRSQAWRHAVCLFRRPY